MSSDELIFQIEVLKSKVSSLEAAASASQLQNKEPPPTTTDNNDRNIKMKEAYKKLKVRLEKAEKEMKQLCEQYERELNKEKKTSEEALNHVEFLETALAESKEKSQSLKEALNEAEDGMRSAACCRF